MSDYSTIQQYQPLRVPQGWERQEKALIVQLEEIFDDIYRRFGRLKLSDMSKDFRSSFTDMEGNMAEITLDVTGLTTRMGDAEGNISTLQLTASSLTSSIGNWQSQSTITQTINSLDSRISSLGYGTVYMQPEEPDHAELVPGDIWIQTQSSGTWSEIYSDYSTWQSLYNTVSTWQSVGGAPIMWVWDGRKWQKQLDSLEGDTLETEIQQNAFQISLLASRTTAVEGDLTNKYTIQSGISITYAGIDISGSQYVKIASGGVLQVTTGNFGIDTGSSTYVLWSGDSTAANAPFWVKKSGEIKATSGTIGGFALGVSTMTAGSGSSFIGMNASSGNVYAIWAGDATPSSAPFWVKKNGTIKAVSGSIGGWTLASNSMTSGSGATYMNLNSNTSNTYAMWAGAESSTNAPFRLKRDGTLYVASLIVLNETGTETTTNLRTAGLWKLAYNVIKSYTVTSGFCTAMVLSNGTTINFKQAADARAEGWAAAANTVSATMNVNTDDVGTFVWLYVPTSSYGQTVMKKYYITDLLNAAWVTGYNAAAAKFNVTGSTSGKITFPVTTSTYGDESTSTYDITADVTNPAQGYYMGIAYVNYIQRATRSRQFS